MVQPFRAINEIGSRYKTTQKHILDEPGRNLIRAIYANPEYGTIEQSVTLLVQKLGAPRSTVLSWAQRMGLQRARDDYWSEEEIAYLSANYERLSVAAIARHLNRSQNAVRIKARRLKFRRVEGDDYSARSLADAMGCHRSTVERWIERKLLFARWDEEAKRWHISTGAVRSFIIAYPREVDHRLCEWTWLLDILVGSEEIGKIKQKRGK